MMRQISAFLIVALMMGLGWAIRGHFGHEQGAAWAGAIGALAILVVTRRKDWVQRMPVLVFLGAIGWGAGGMMSYGKLVGYGRGTDFFNVFYGLSMLAVVGGLYGFLGGGLLGLGLETTKEKAPKWHLLISEMVAGAWICWGLLVYQLEIQMTPPRSELWAACLGISLALTWFCYRNKFFGALHLAKYAALGGGFGFAFGNFLQVMGNVSGISINWWNVMEFTLGFCGGLGMIYAIYTYEWPESSSPSGKANWLALVFLFLFIPLINIQQTFEPVKFHEMAAQIGYNPQTFANLQIILALFFQIIFLISGLFIWQRGQNKRRWLIHSGIPIFLLGYSLWYLLYSHLVKGTFYTGFTGQPEQMAYWVILIIAAVIWIIEQRKWAGPDFPVKKSTETWRRWIWILSGFIAILLILTIIAINSHGEMPGAQLRF
jgi:hypothetical protein